MIISESDRPEKFADEVGELRAIPGHMLRATGVQIPQDELDHLRSEEDGIFEDEDPQDLLGSVWLVFNTS